MPRYKTKTIRADQLHIQNSFLVTHSWYFRLQKKHFMWCGYSRRFILVYWAIYVYHVRGSILKTCCLKYMKEVTLTNALIEPYSWTIIYMIIIITIYAWNISLLFGMSWLYFELETNHVRDVINIQLTYSKSRQTKTTSRFLKFEHYIWCPYCKYFGKHYVHKNKFWKNQRYLNKYTTCPMYWI